MTASPDPHVGLPSEEEIARAIYHSKPRNKPWEVLTNEFKNQYRKQARTILSLIRPAFEAKDAEIGQRAEEDLAAEASLDLWRQRALSAEAKLAQAVEAGKVVLSHRVGDLPTSGYLRDNGTSRKALAELAAIIALAEGKEG